MEKEINLFGAAVPTQLKLIFRSDWADRALKKYRAEH